MRARPAGRLRIRRLVVAGVLSLALHAMFFGLGLGLFHSPRGAGRTASLIVDLVPPGSPGDSDSTAPGQSGTSPASLSEGARSASTSPPTQSRLDIHAPAQATVGGRGAAEPAVGPSRGGNPRGPASPERAQPPAPTETASAASLPSRNLAALNGIGPVASTAAPTPTATATEASAGPSATEAAGAGARSSAAIEGARTESAAVAPEGAAGSAATAAGPSGGRVIAGGSSRVVTEAGGSGGADSSGAAGPGSADAESAYFGRIMAAIDQSKVYPLAARMRGTQGDVRLRLSISADGRLLGIRLAASSGSSLLDEAALELVERVFPLSNPTGRRLEPTLTVRYSLGP